jgi:hypothetical protein
LNDGPTHTHFGDRTCDGLRAVGRFRAAAAQLARGFVALPERPEPLEGSRFGAFALGMRELGYIERRNLTIEWRFAGGEVGRLAELAAEVVQRKVDVSWPARHR